MKLNLKAGEHVRIENDSGAGFTTYVEGGIVHVTARSLDDPVPETEVVREPDYWSASRYFRGLDS